MNTLKIFVFNSDDPEGWDSDSGYAIVAETKEEADKIYLNQVVNPNPYKIEEVEIKDGLILSAFGYDACRLDIVTPRPPDPPAQHFLIVNGKFPTNG